MKHYTFKTKSIAADAPTNSVESYKCDNLYPYITYKCKSPVNLNFLFRELVYDDGKVSMVPTYANGTDALLDDVNSGDDVSSTMGAYYCMRFINTIVNSELKMSDEEQSKLDTRIFDYDGNKYGFTTGDSIQSSDPKLATMDFGEFFQVALSAIRNKSTNAEISGRNGLVDRENINNAAVRGDLCSRTVSDLRKSELLQTLLISSTQPTTVSTETIDNNSSLNWMKNLVYDIITKSMHDKENIERFMAIKKPGCSNHLRIIRLLGGDSIVLVFKIKLTNKNGILLNNECPDKQGIPMTIGFRIEQVDNTCAPPSIPIGWQPVYTHNDPPTNVSACINEDTYVITVTWNHPSSDEYKKDGFSLFYIIVALDTRTNVSKTVTIPYSYYVFSEQVGQVSPGCHDILISMYSVYIKNDIQISSSPVSIKKSSMPVKELNVLSVHTAPPYASTPNSVRAASVDMNNCHSVMCIVDPPAIPIFANKYSIILIGEPNNKSLIVESSTNSFVINELPNECATIKIAPIFIINNSDYIGIYSSQQISKKHDIRETRLTPQVCPPYTQPYHHMHAYPPYMHAYPPYMQAYDLRSTRCGASYQQPPNMQAYMHMPKPHDNRCSEDDDTSITFTWKSVKDSSDLVVIIPKFPSADPDSPVYVNVDNNIKTTTFGGFVVYRNLQPGKHTIGVFYEHDGVMSKTVTKNCTIIHNMETSG